MVGREGYIYIYIFYVSLFVLVLKERIDWDVGVGVWVLQRCHLMFFHFLLSFVEGMSFLTDVPCIFFFLVRYRSSHLTTECLTVVFIMSSISFRNKGSSFLASFYSIEELGCREGEPGGKTAAACVYTTVYITVVPFFSSAHKNKLFAFKVWVFL